MAQTVIEVRTLRRGTAWVTVVTISAPGLKAPLSFASASDIRGEVGALRAFFGPHSASVEAANVVSKKKSLEQAIAYAKGFVDKNPGYFGASLSWASDVLTALAKSNELLAKARAGDKASRDTISKIANKSLAKDPDGVRSMKLLFESARLLDQGRATMRVKVEGNTSTGHDIGTRKDLRLTGGKFHIGGAQVLDRHRYTPSMHAEFSDDHELVVHDPFNLTPYTTSSERNTYN